MGSLRKKIRDYFRQFSLGGWSIEKPLFDYIRNHLAEGKTILELGSGFGTGQLARYYRMISVEDNPKYLNKYKSQYIYAPRKGDWYDSDVLSKALPKYDYELLLVDGPYGEKSRWGFLDHLGLFRNDVPILFDDTHAQKWRDLAEAVATALGRPYQHYQGEEKAFGVIPSLPEA